jgi:hypothetical protein
LTGGAAGKRCRVPNAGFTYEVRSADKDAVGVEDYVVRTGDADPATFLVALTYPAHRRPYESRGARKP